MGHSDVTRCAKASKPVSSHEGGVSAKHVLRLDSFWKGAKNDDIGSLAAQLYQVNASGCGSEFRLCHEFLQPYKPFKLHLCKDVRF